MAGKGLAIAGVVVIAVLVIVLLITPSVILEDNSLNFNSVVYGMKDGRRVTPPLAFIVSDVEVDALGCDASWTAVGSGLDWATLVIAGEYTIYFLDYAGAEEDITPFRLDFQRFAEAAKEDSVHFEIPLDNLVIGHEYSGYSTSRELYYWTLKVIIDVTGTVEQDITGVPPLTDFFVDDVTYTVYWMDGDFSLSGGIIR